MPIPPILDVFVVWHPDDPSGAMRFEELQKYFHGPAFAGLVGGAVEVYARSTPWTASGAPRPFGITKALMDGLPSAQFNAVVPVLSLELAEAARDEPWATYLREIAELKQAPEVGIFSIPAEGVDLANGALAPSLGDLQTLPKGVLSSPSVLGRELSQAITQSVLRAADEPERVKVFISHSKHLSLAEDDDSPAVYDSVRKAISSSHLSEFFDAHDIQSGSTWAKELEFQAARDALLIVRTDRYAEREWTQREVLVAKQAEVPVVTMYALKSGEERGSFLMDHVPSVVCDLNNRDAGINEALNALVAEVLKATLWRFQRVYIEAEGFDWLPAHSPEPVTLVGWLANHKVADPNDQHIWIMHPDPPLGSAEREVLIEMLDLSGYSADVNIYTPRTFAQRGGSK